MYPELYGDMYHKVRINYYPPRGDNKEGWDNIDIFGWLGYPMQIKIDFLCRDSILAAPIVVVVIFVVIVVGVVVVVVVMVVVLVVVLIVVVVVVAVVVVVVLIVVVVVV